MSLILLFLLSFAETVPRLDDLESLLVKQPKKVVILSEEERKDFNLLFKSFNDPKATSDEKITLLNGFQKNKTGKEILFFSEKVKEVQTLDTAKNLAILLRLSTEYYSGEDIADIAAKNLLELNKKFDVKKQIEKLPKNSIAIEPSTQYVSGNKKEFNKLQVMVELLKTNENKGQVILSLLDSLKNKKTSDLLSCHENTLQNNFDLVRSTLLKSSEFDDFLNIATNDGKSELEAILKRGKFEELPRLGREYFYSLHGLKAELLHSYLLLKASQPMPAAAHIQKALSTIDILASKIKNSQQKENYLKLKSQFEILGTTALKATYDADQLQYSFMSTILSAIIANGPYIHQFVTDEKLIFKNLTKNKFSLKELATPCSDKVSEILALYGDKFLKGNNYAFLKTLDEHFTEHTAMPRPLNETTAPLIALALKDSDEEVQIKAFLVLERMNSAVLLSILPELIEVADSSNTSLKCNAMVCIQKMGPNAKSAVPVLIKNLKSEVNLHVLQNIFKTIAAIGPDAEEAVPALIEILSKPKFEIFGYSIYLQVAHALTGIGEKAVPPLMKFLKETRWEEKSSYPLRSAAKALGDMGEKAAPAIETLVEILKKNKEDYLGKVEVIEALGKMGEKADVATPILVEIVQNKFSRWRENAAISISNLGPKGRAALISLFQEEDTLYFARIAYQRSDKKLADHLPELLKFLDDPKRSTIVIDFISRMGEEAKLAVPDLVKKLQATSDIYIKKQIILTLGKIRDEKTVPILIQFYNSTSTQKMTALQAIEYFGKNAELALPTLMKALKEEDSDVRESALSALSTFEEKAIPALSDVLKIAESATRNEKKLALFSLGKMGGKASDQTMPVILKQLMGPDFWMAIEALRAMGDESIPFLIKALKDPNSENRRLALMALGELGPVAKAVIPSLEQLIKTEKIEQINFHAREILNKLNSPSSDGGLRRLQVK